VLPIKNIANSNKNAHKAHKLASCRQGSDLFDAILNPLPNYSTAPLAPPNPGQNPVVVGINKLTATPAGALDSTKQETTKQQLLFRPWSELYSLRKKHYVGKV